jgi:hypothetical protein
LAYVPSRAGDDDFAFVVGERTHHCPAISADFLSRRIANLHATDPSLRRFAVATPDPDGRFPEFLALARGSPLILTDANRPFFAALAIELLNSELCDYLFSGDAQALTFENAFDRITFLAGLDRPYAAELDFIATQFYKFAPSDFSALSFDIVYHIVSHPRLKLISEDSLFGFIALHFAQNRNYFSLLEFIRFEFLTHETVIAAVDLITASFDLFNLSLFTALRPLLLSPRTLALPKLARFVEPPPPAVDCPFREGAPLDGVIAHLTRTAGGNVHEKGVVEVAASSSKWNGPHTSVADLEQTDNFFLSEDEPDQWIAYRFKNAQVAITHYSVTSAITRGWYELKNWVLEGSVDGVNWAEIDKRVAETRLLEPKTTVTFAVANPGTFAEVRLRQLGKNRTGYYHMCVGAFELFGRFVPVTEQ